MAMDNHDHRPRHQDQYPEDDIHDYHRPRPAQPALSASVPSIQSGPLPGYTLMVAGRRTGKTSFLRLLLDTCIIAPTVSQDQLASVARFVQGGGSHTTNLRSVSVDVELAQDDSDSTRPLELTLIDTPSLDFDDEAASHRAVQDILRHVEAKFTESVHDRQKAATGDHHVHLCVYFLDPDDVVPPSVSSPPAPLVPRARADSHTKSEPERVILDPPVPTNPTHLQPKLPPADIITIRALSQRVNVLPVVARADTLTNDRLAAVKLAIRRDLAEAGIGFGIFDVDPVSQYENSDLPPKYNGESYTNGTASSPASSISTSLLRLPFALISPDNYSHSDGVVRGVPSRHEIAAQYDPSYRPNSPKRHPRSNLIPGKFVRSYRWGSLDVLDTNHCDFAYLRTAVFQHMETLQKYTREYLFERFRAELHPDALETPHGRLRQASGDIHRLPPPLIPGSRPILAIDIAPSHPVSSRHPSLAMPRSAINGDASISAPSAQPMSVVSDLSPKTASSTTMGTSGSQRQRTKKINVACNFCRSRKLKCDGGRPACSQCSKRNNPCDYTVTNKRRGNGGRRRKQFDDGASESGDESGDPSGDPDPSASPEVPSSSKDSSRRNSRGEVAALSEITLPPLMQAMERRDDQASGPLLPPMAQSASALLSTAPSSEPRGYSNHELPPIATLSSASMNGSAHEHALPPLRNTVETQQSQQGRRRTSSASTKASRASSGYGSKVVACNYCRTRKTKCDGGHPTCGSCARRSLQCNYVNDPTGANPKGRPKTAGSVAASAAGVSAPTSSRSSPSAPVPPPSGAANMYLRHNPQVENGVEVTELKRTLDSDHRLPTSNKKMRIMDDLAPPPTAAVAVGVAQIP